MPATAAFGPDFIGRVDQVLDAAQVGRPAGTLGIMIAFEDLYQGAPQAWRVLAQL
jgi:hypothetical protein